jgi:hypothetical protein
MKDANEVKKELYKSKVNARLDRVEKAVMYYEVELSDGTYQFPIDTVEPVDAILYKLEANVQESKTEHDAALTYTKVKERYFTRSSDLGSTPFLPLMKASELNRWIGKAIEKDEFVKVK